MIVIVLQLVLTLLISHGDIIMIMYVQRNEVARKWNFWMREIKVHRGYGYYSGFV